LLHRRQAATHAIQAAAGTVDRRLEAADPAHRVLLFELQQRSQADVLECHPRSPLPLVLATPGCVCLALLAVDQHPSPLSAIRRGCIPEKRPNRSRG
jgi:hypothetical protein